MHLFKNRFGLQELSFLLFLNIVPIHFYQYFFTRHLIVLYFFKSNYFHFIFIKYLLKKFENLMGFINVKITFFQLIKNYFILYFLLIFEIFLFTLQLKNVSKFNLYNNIYNI